MCVQGYKNGLLSGKYIFKNVISFISRSLCKSLKFFIFVLLPLKASPSPSYPILHRWE